MGHDAQRTVAVIPARGGSKGLPRKNVRVLRGKPLVAHTVEDAVHARCVDRTIVSTDDMEIAQVAREYGAEVLVRPQELAHDDSPSEAALLHVLDWLEADGYHPGLVVFLQATSPLREPRHVDGAVHTLTCAKANSLVSVVPSHRFLWSNVDGEWRPLNYDPACRPRRQEMVAQYMENGSIYVFEPWVLRECRSRLGGKIVGYPMEWWTGFEIDSEEDFRLCEWLMSVFEATGRELPDDVRLVVFDFDGVMTNNRVLTLDDGKEGVVCNRADGAGVAMLKDVGIEVMVLSSEVNSVVSRRCEKLRISCLQGVRNKSEELQRSIAERGLHPSQVVYVGNDLNDLDCMRIAGCSVAVADAHPLVRQAAAIILTRAGGEGAVRELCELLWLLRRDKLGDTSGQDRR